jgi:hypothetical protein
MSKLFSYSTIFLLGFLISNPSWSATQPTPKTAQAKKTSTASTKSQESKASHLEPAELFNLALCYEPYPYTQIFRNNTYCFWF